MTHRTRVELTAASVNCSALRVAAANAQKHLHLARQLSPLPEGSIDLFDDLDALQRTIERLQKQVNALAAGEPIPIV